jgi:hypothetical protein
MRRHRILPLLLPSHGGSRTTCPQPQLLPGDSRCPVLLTHLLRALAGLNRLTLVFSGSLGQSGVCSHG